MIFSSVKTGLSSMVLNFYHLGAKQISARTARLERMNHHAEQAFYYYTKGWNAFYELVGSKRRLNAIEPSSLSVKTRNHLVPELNHQDGWRQIADKAQNLLKNASITYLKPHEKQQIDPLSQGVCQGMVQVFISDYCQARMQGLPFQEAAIKAAKSFERGASLLAAKLQYIHHWNKVDHQEFDNAFQIEKYSDSDRSFLRNCPSIFYGHHFLGAKRITFDKIFVGDLGLETLADGSYDITVGGKVISDPKGNQTYIRDKGHAVALLVDQKSYLIFDPDKGLFPHPQPARYFENLDSSFPEKGRGMLLCHWIQF